MSLAPFYICTVFHSKGLPPKGGEKTMFKKSLISVSIFIILVATVVAAADNDEVEYFMKYTSSGQVYKATSHYLTMHRYIRSSDGFVSIIVVLDNPYTPQVGDAVAIFRNGELEEFWEEVNGELRMVFRKTVRRIESYI